MELGVARYVAIYLPSGSTWFFFFVVSDKPSDSGEEVEQTFNRRYVMQKLEYGRGRIWQDVQQKVKTYVLASDLSHFKLEEFIQVLDLINRSVCLLRMI